MEDIELGSLKSGVALKLERPSLPLTPAGRLEFVMTLLNGQDTYDEYGNYLGKTPPLINTEEAREILGVSVRSDKKSKLKMFLEKLMFWRKV